MPPWASAAREGAVKHNTKSAAMDANQSCLAYNLGDTASLWAKCDVGKVRAVLRKVNLYGRKSRMAKLAGDELCKHATEPGGSRPVITAPAAAF